jgi:hypothetical protein
MSVAIAPGAIPLILIPLSASSKAAGLGSLEIKALELANVKYCIYILE